jgi:hypothetical protein
MVIKMYTKLIIRINGQELEFKAHEIVLIAQNVIENYVFPEDIASQVFMPTPPMYRAFVSKMAKDLTDIGIIEGRLDPYITIPMHIEGLDTSVKWLYIAKRLNLLYQQDCQNHPMISVYEGLGISDKNTKGILVEDVSDYIICLDQDGRARDYKAIAEPKRMELSSGTWIKIADRLVLVKNTVEMTYYVSDHGYIFDIIDKVRHLVFDFDWTNPHWAQAIVAVEQKMKGMSPEELAEFKKNFVPHISNISDKDIDFLRSQYPDKSDVQLHAIAQAAAEEFTNDPVLSFLDIDESNRFILHILLKKYMQMKFRDHPNFDHEIYHDFYVYGVDGEPISEDTIDGIYRPWELRLEDAKNLIKRMVLQRVADDINFGLHEPLFRPVTSYGNREQGPSYHVFAATVKAYFTTKEHMTDAEIAGAIRLILRGDVPKLGEANFIPNLVAAWFISEPTRNPSSFLSGMMLIDMIESGIELPDGHGNNWYDLYYTLVHPLKDLGIGKVQDLYGSKDGVDRFGGSHPMAHGGSATHSVPDEGKKLTAVQQKEASLYFHWLKIRLEKMGIECRLVSDNEEKLKASDVKFSNLARANKQYKEELEELNKKVLKAEKDYKLSKSELSKEKAKKKLDDFAVDKEALKARYEASRQDLLLKEVAVMKYIIPLLYERLDTLDNLLTYADLPDTSPATITDNKVSSSVKSTVSSSINYTGQDLGAIAIDMDGNCMYNSLLAAIKRLSDYEGNRYITLEELRIVVAEEIEQNQAVYFEALEVQIFENIRDGDFAGFQGFLRTIIQELHFTRENARLRGENLVTVDDNIRELIATGGIVGDYINMIQLNATWGGNVELGILSHIIGVQIIVHRRNGDIDPPINNTGNIDALAVHLDYNGGHYNLIIMPGMEHDQLVEHIDPSINNTNIPDISSGGIEDDLASDTGSLLLGLELIASEGFSFSSIFQH